MRHDCGLLNGTSLNLSRGSGQLAGSKCCNEAWKQRKLGYATGSRSTSPVSVYQAPRSRLPSLPSPRSSINQRVERTMAAITADLKTKDLAQRLSHSLLSTSFMKFRGPEALKDSLLGSRSRHSYAIKWKLVEYALRQTSQLPLEFVHHAGKSISFRTRLVFFEQASEARTKLGTNKSNRSKKPLQVSATNY
jgi:hypothetical protein